MKKSKVQITAKAYSNFWEKGNNSICFESYSRQLKSEELCKKGERMKCKLVFTKQSGI